MTVPCLQYSHRLRVGSLGKLSQSLGHTTGVRGTAGQAVGRGICQETASPSCSRALKILSTWLLSSGKGRGTCLYPAFQLSNWVRKEQGQAQEIVASSSQWPGSLTVKPSQFCLSSPLLLEQAQRGWPGCSEGALWPVCPSAPSQPQVLS